ncbi:MAG: hypothetical protein JO235_04395 [Chroococcidiopsidaceae cyanobacterium CP_BM_RX_35]|nr:hypothetical protein [Chroococcidiopsidaceae cyanobacterium CP_BM_RX_35]
MVYVTQARQNERIHQTDFPALVDPTVLRVARQIYHTYCEVNPNLVQRTTGVIVNQLTHRGLLTFCSKPVLLPQECFITLNQIEAGMLI